MFSSNSSIFRGGADEPRPLVLEPLGGMALRGGASSGGFVLLPLGEESGTGAPAPEVLPVELPHEIPTVPEEEALARIEAAYQDGYREGKQDAEGELASVSEALAQGLIATESLRRSLFQESEEDLLKLAMLVARRIILREISLEPGILAGMVQGALEFVAECDEVVVRINPDDHGYVAASHAFQQLSSEKRRIVLKPDHGVEHGGCMVETVRGNVDARLESQLDEIYRRLSEERSSRRDDQHDAD